MTHPTTPIRINTSRSRLGWSTFEYSLVCPQAAAYDQAGRKAEEELPTNHPPFIKGTLMHVALAHHCARTAIDKVGTVKINGQEVKSTKVLMTPHQALDFEAQEADEALVNAGRAPVWGGYAGPILAKLDTYLGSMAAVDQYMVPLYIETEFGYRVQGTSPLLPGHVFDFIATSRLDLVVLDQKTGKILIDDHKTTVRMDDAFTRAYGMSGQIALQREIGRERFGDQFGGMFLRGFQWEPFKFVRQPPISNPLLQGQLRDQLLFRAALMRVLKQNKTPLDEYPKAASPGICEHKWGTCRWLNRCRFGSASQG